MSMNMTTFLRNSIRTHLLRTGSWTKPSELWVALHTGAPGADASANQVSGGAYARAQLDPADANWTAETTDGESKNAAAITFPAPSGANWGSITHVSVWDASTGGNSLLQGALTTPKTVNDGDPAPSFPIGDLDIAFT